jgi:Flp pilus assembly protein TadG
MSGLRGWSADACGQSLVEIALTLPLLLLIVTGIVDIGRLYAYKSATENAAREAAIYAARDSQATAGDICQRARDELGAGVGTCSTAPITVTCRRGGRACGDQTVPPVLYQTAGAGGADITVTVTYRASLLTGYLIGRAFQLNPVPISGTAAFVGLGE